MNRGPRRKGECQTTSGIDPLATRRIDPPGWLLTIKAALAERVVHGVDRGNPRRERAPSIARRATARGYLWAPVGELRSRCGRPQSVSPKAARRLDAGQFVEIEIKDGLQRLTGGAVAQRLGQRIEPCCILSLEPQECGDSAVPLLRSAGLADRPRQCRAVVSLPLAIAGLALGPGQRVLTLRLAASAARLTEQRRGAVFRHVTIPKGLTPPPRRR